MLKRLKVLHVEAGRHLYGGARQVAYLLEGLEAEGVHNLLVCPRGSAIAEAAAHQGVEVRALPMGGDLDIAFVWRLWRLIRAERPDVVHLHSRRGADLLGGIAARLAGVKTVLARRVDNPEARAWVALKYRLYDRVVAISEGIQKVLLDEGLPPEKVVCVHSAVDATPYLRPCERDWFRQAFRLKAGQRAIGVVAQLIARKGHRFVLDAMPAILAKHPDVRVLFFGQGPLEAGLRDEIGRRGLSGHVQLAGFRDDLERILPCLDMVVHPALMEGLGVSLLQASAAAVPVVAARAGGIPEAVADGENGFLVAPGSGDELAEKILRLLDDPGLARRLGARGRERVTERFSIQAMVAGNLAVYLQLLGMTALTDS